MTFNLLVVCTLKALMHSETTRSGSCYCLTSFDTAQSKNSAAFSLLAAFNSEVTAGFRMNCGNESNPVIMLLSLRFHI